MVSEISTAKHEIERSYLGVHNGVPTCSNSLKIETGLCSQDQMKRYKQDSETAFISIPITVPLIPMRPQCLRFGSSEDMETPTSFDTIPRTLS